MKQTHHGCSATIRPSVCKLENNLCCLSCEFVKECTDKIKADKTLKIRALPCTLANFDEIDFCEFGV